MAHRVRRASEGFGQPDPFNAFDPHDLPVVDDQLDRAVAQRRQRPVQRRQELGGHPRGPQTSVGD